MNLTVKSESGGKTFYEPIICLCKGGSKYNKPEYNKPPEKHQFYFEDLPDYWTINDHDAPIVGDWYKLELSTKPSDNGMWRDIVSIEPAGAEPAPISDEDALFAGKPEPGQERAEKPNAGINNYQSTEDAKWDAIRDEKNYQIRRGQAFNAAIEKIDPVFFGSLMHMNDACLELRRLRDGFLRVLVTDPMSEHHCYVHDVVFQKGNTGYGHKVDGGWCIEDKGAVLEGEG